MYRTTREHIEALERAGELRRIHARVSPLLEIAEIADRVSKSAAPRAPSEAARATDPAAAGLGGPALLFEDVEGSHIPVLINAFGSYRRMEMALGCEGGGFASIADRLAELTRPEPPRTWREAIRKARRLAPLLRIGPKRLRGPGLCQEVVRTGDDVDLSVLPIIRCWPLDGDYEAVGYPGGVNDDIEGVDSSPEFRERFRGRYITLAGVHTIHARDEHEARPSSHNIGMYRVQMLGRRHMAMHWHVHHDGAAHWRSWKALGKRMPVAIALGGESVLPYAATCPLPPGISELFMAGFLNGRGIHLCRAKTVPLWVPANAEIVIEGWVSNEAGHIGWDPRDEDAGQLGPGAVFEGPFGDHTGFYSMPDRYPILEVTAITHRRDPVYPTTIVGLPPQEDYYLGKATERIMLPLLRTILPDIEDYDLPMFGAFHNLAFIRIRKQYPFHARRVMHGVWGAGQMSWTKCVFVVDQDVDVHDMPAVLRAAAARCHPGRDIELVHGPLDILDHATPHLGAGMKIGFDCTERRPEESANWIEVSPLPGADPPSEGEVNDYVDRVRAIEGVADVALPASLGHGWLIVSIAKNQPGQGRGVASELMGVEAPGEMRSPAYVIVVGEGVNVHDTDLALFHWVANMSPGRDAIWSADRSRIGFDSTPKTAEDEANGCPVRAWPPLIEMDKATRNLVDERWSEYGL